MLEDLAADWDVPVYAHDLERPYLDGSASYPDGGGLVSALSPLFPTRPVNVSDRLRSLPADRSVPHMPDWQWIHTPGHSVGHVSFWRDGDGAMIVGGTFVTTAQESAYAAVMQSSEMHGPPRYMTVDWLAARSSVEALAALRPNLVITGHGHAMRGATMTAALVELARGFDRIAVPQHGGFLERPARAEDGSAYRVG